MLAFKTLTGAGKEVGVDDMAPGDGDLRALWIMVRMGPLFPTS